jgi:hypothetical protein
VFSGCLCNVFSSASSKFGVADGFPYATARNLRKVCILKTKAHLPSTRGLLTMFDTMGTRLARLGEKDGGFVISQPTQPKDTGQDAHG